MEQEKKILLQVDTGGSEKTVKSLKKDISDLKDAILNLEKGTKEYDEAVEQLQASQRELNEVQALTKRTATALEGSYDALTHQMGLLKKEWRATNDETKRNELGKQIDELNNQLKELDASTGNYQRNVGNYVSHWEGAPDVFAELKAEIKETRNALLQLEEGTEEYNAALAKLGNAQFQLRDITEASRYATADLGEQLDNVSNIGASVAAGFSAIQAAMVLCGKDGENLQKTMVKIQAAMALVQGLKGIEGLGKQLKGLSIALKTLTGISAGWVTAILAVVAATAAVIKNLPIVKQREAEWAAQTERTKKIQSDLRDSIEKGNEKLQDRIDILKAQGVAEKELLSIQTASAKADMENAEKNYRETLATEKRMLEMAETMTAGAFKQIYGMSKKDAKEFYAERTRESKETYDETLTLYENYLHKTDILNEEEKNRFRERLKQYEEALKSEEDKLKEQYERDLANAEKYGYDKTVIEKKYQADLKAIRDKYNQSLKSTVSVDIATETALDKKIKLEEKATERKLQLLEIEKVKEQSNVYQTITNKEELTDKLEEIERRYADEEYNIELKLQQDILALWNKELETLAEGSKEKVDLAQKIADKEIAIELYKQNRLKDINKQDNEDRQKTSGTTSGTTSGETKTPFTDKYNAMMAEADSFKDYWNVFEQTFKDFDKLWDEMSFSDKMRTVESLAQTSLEMGSNLVNAVADMYEADGELSLQEAKKVKNLRISAGIIDTISGAIAAYTSAQSLGVPLGPIVGAANAAAVTAMGMMNVNKIRNTAISAANAPSVNGIATPNVSAYSSELPATYTRNITTSSEIDELNKEQRVYILESDIQESNKKVSIRESESSF